MGKMEEKNNKPSNEKGNPYKALNFYEETDHDVFFGREEESEKLFQMVKFNRLTVVFGKSGMGKTSLLNAGLFPRLRQEEFRPIWIRFNFSKTASPLKEQICSAYEAGLTSNEIDKSKVGLESQIQDIPPTPLSADETLWEYFRRVVHFKLTKEKEKKTVTPVLVFDQFEEIFTVGKQHEEKDRIIDELYWLIEDQLPPQVKERVKKDDRTAKKITYSDVGSHFKVILSLREDYLPHLNDLKTRIPSIDQALFRLTHLNGKQARAIISKPEKGFKNEDTIKAILHRFDPKRETGKEDIPEEKLEIEPALLSLLCHQMFEKKMFESVTTKALDTLLEDYYDSKMKKYPKKVQEFIESKLLTEGGFRTPHYLEEAHRLRKHIEKLVNQRILRKFYEGHGQFVEIVHDALASIIEKRRSRRRKRKRNRLIYLLTAGIVGLSLLTGFAFYQMSRADKQANIAQVNRLAAEASLELSKDNTRAIRILKEAIKKAKDKSATWPLQVLGRIVYSSYDRPFYINAANLDANDVIYSAVFSTDNRYILTGHEYGTARIRDLDGNLLLKLEGHKGRIMSALFSADETMILTASWDKTTRLWNREGKLLQELRHDGSVYSASFSADGKSILTAALDNTARLWNLQGKQLHVFPHEKRVISAVFSPDDRTILTASWDKTARLWTREGRLLTDLNKHDNILTFAGFSPDGRTILTASWDKTARLWNDTGEELSTFDHGSPILSSLFSPDGQYILTAAVDGTVKLWDLEKKELKTSIRHESPISKIAFSPDGHLILTASEDGVIKLSDLQGNQRAHFDKHSQKIWAAAFSANGHYLFTSSHGEIAVLWDLQSNFVIELEHNEPVSEAVVSPDGTSVITITDAGAARLWKDNGKSSKPLSYGERVFTAIFSPQMDFFLTASKNGIISLWDRNGNPIKSLEMEENQLSSIDLSRDGKNFLTVSSGNAVVTLWQLDGTRSGSFEQVNIVSAAFLQDRTRIFTASGNGRITIRDLAGNIQREIKPTMGNRELVSVSLSPDGKRILTLPGEGPVELWDLEGKLLRRFEHDRLIYSAAFSPNGKYVLTASLDKTAKLWSLVGDLLATFDHKGTVRSAAFSLDGKWVVTASRDNTAKVWLTPEAIFQWLQESKIPPLSKKEDKNPGTPPDKK
jgi:WD40 repeat protein